MNRLASFISAAVLLTAHSVCTIVIAVFSRKLYADEGNDTRGFFTVKFGPKLADRGLGNAIQAASQAAAQGHSAVNGAVNTANKVISSAEAIVTSAVDKILHENAEITLGTSKACVGAGDDKAACASIPRPGGSSDDGPEKDAFQDAAKIMGAIAKLLRVDGLGSLLTNIADKADSWWLTPTRMSNVGMITAILSTAVYCVSLCGGAPSDWAKCTLTLLVITLSLLSVAVFGGLRYIITAVNGIASHAAGRVGQFQAGPSLRDSDVSMVSAIAQVIVTALHAVQHCLTRRKTRVNGDG